MGPLAPFSLRHQAWLPWRGIHANVDEASQFSSSFLKRWEGGGKAVTTPLPPNKAQRRVGVRWGVRLGGEDGGIRHHHDLHVLPLPSDAQQAVRACVFTANGYGYGMF